MLNEIKNPDDNKEIRKKSTEIVGNVGSNANNLRKSNRIFRRSNFPLMRTKRTLKRTIRFDRNGLTHTK